MKSRLPVSADNVMATAFLIGLALLALCLWFKDPAHRPSGESRVNWPPAASAKP